MSDRILSDLRDLPVEGHGRGIRYDAWRARMLECALLGGVDEDCLVIVEAPAIVTDQRGLADRTDRVHVVRQGVVRTHSRRFSSRDDVGGGSRPTVLKRLGPDAVASFSDGGIVVSDARGEFRMGCPFVYRGDRLALPTERDLEAFVPPSPVRAVTAVASRIEPRGHRAMVAAFVAALLVLAGTFVASVPLAAALARWTGMPDALHAAALTAYLASSVAALLFLKFAARTIERWGTPATPAAFPVSGGLNLAALTREGRRYRRIEIDEDRFAKPRMSWRGVVRLPREVLVLLSDGSSAFMRADQALAQVPRP